MSMDLADDFEAAMDLVSTLDQTIQDIDKFADKLAERNISPAVNTVARTIHLQTARALKLVGEFCRPTCGAEGDPEQCPHGGFVNGCGCPCHDHEAAS